MALQTAPNLTTKISRRNTRIGFEQRRRDFIGVAMPLLVGAGYPTRFSAPALTVDYPSDVRLERLDLSHIVSVRLRQRPDGAETRLMIGETRPRFLHVASRRLVSAFTPSTSLVVVSVNI